MQNKESFIPDDWFKNAKKDLERVKLRLEEEDLEEAAVHLQQALEKYLKGYLLSKGWHLKKIHDLAALLAEAIKYNPELEKFMEFCQEVSAYYFEDRYPFFAEGPSGEEIKVALLKAEELVREIMQFQK